MVMTRIDPKEVQRLRSESGAGVMDCKRALEETGGDYAKALALIKERGIQSVAKKSEREAKEGLVASYVHSGGRIGALVELASETDFVSRGDEFQKRRGATGSALHPRRVEDDQGPCHGGGGVDQRERARAALPAVRLGRVLNSPG